MPVMKRPGSRSPDPTGGVRLVTVVVLVVTGLLALVAWRLIRVPEPEAPTLAAPEFQLASLDGQRIGPEDYEGQVLLIDFWATWCTPCHLQARILDGLYDDYRERGVEFLAISTGEVEGIVRQFVTDHPYRYPVLIDPEDNLSQQLGIYALPTLMVIDSHGDVAYFRPGVTPAKALRRILDEALEG